MLLLAATAIAARFRGTVEQEKYRRVIELDGVPSFPLIFITRASVYYGNDTLYSTGHGETYRVIDCCVRQRYREMYFYAREIVREMEYHGTPIGIYNK